MPAGECVRAELYLLHHRVCRAADVDTVTTSLTVPDAEFEIDEVRERSTRDNG
jgi:hypothetical protein